ncbi:MAG TPA: nickel pincer cofactor biosynthesis protein LarC [Gemmatimonadales bacterium]|nr:nickel pincer cofactor biosynthesis protein LarC [Gemmatimonadales bacterium]
MSSRTFALIDPAAGISGDMLLGALLDSGAPREWLRELPARLGLPQVTIRIGEDERCGIRCSRVTVCLPGDEIEGPGAPHSVAEGHHGHHHGHRRIGDLIGLIERAGLSPWVRERAVRAFELLGEAEGRVHGLPARDVPLHEVGAWDAVVDIVGGIEGFERLGIKEIYTRPVALGDGWVRSAHGQIPVPAPATALLVEGLAIAPNGPVRGEATTPTGAALLRVLTQDAPPAQWRPVRSGWGAGTRNPSDYPNALRLILAEPVAEAATVSVLSVDLDDLSPEYLEPLREALSAAGAVDVQSWPTQAKKGRIGFRLDVVVPRGLEAAVADACFRNSTTAGVRWVEAERVTLPRRQHEVRVDGERVRVKVLETPAGIRVKPEYDDVTRVAQLTGRAALEVAAMARSLAEQLENQTQDGDQGP